jgi:hypothetical protein
MAIADPVEADLRAAGQGAGPGGEDLIAAQLAHQIDKGSMRGELMQACERMLAAQAVYAPEAPT